ncbi:uncharacterized protein LOC143198955 [Rhynchophorus ferrugineus]|uniref:uncharacterized protein LOC143198955 n=1 Tax=Rhynchophorus ferrugineus TaxID=354439 RepID=UPI003FCE7C6A
MLNMAQLFPCWIRLLVIICYLAQINTAIKCYICGGERETLPCSDFQIDDPKFQEECGNHRSCKTTRKVSDNGILSRSCESLDIEDCKTANSVEYCFCRRDFCNHISPSDEEDENPGDFLEGSGKQITDDPVIAKTATTTEETTIPRNDVNMTNVISNNQNFSSTGASFSSFKALIIPFCIMCLLK